VVPLVTPDGRLLPGADALLGRLAVLTGEALGDAAGAGPVPARTETGARAGVAGAMPQTLQ
jgi:hypothetical protein